MKQKLLAVFLWITMIATLSACAFGQSILQDQNTAAWGKNGAISGAAVKYPDIKGTITNQFEVLVTGTAPATLTITVAGCMRGGTCSAALATSSGTANQILTPTSSNIYDYYSVTTSWSGGDATTNFVVNRTGTVARLPGTTGGSSFPVTAAQTVNSGGAVTPTGTGQIESSGDWIPQAPGVLVPSVPTAVVANTGGSLIQQQLYIRITYVGLSTIVPSAELRQQLNSTNCASNSTCALTLTMPTSCTAGNLPAGATGCTVWDGITSDAEKQQAAANNCVNITTATCVVTTLAAGSTISTPPQETGVSPSPLFTVTQPDFMVCTNHIQLGDGTWVCVAGVDYSGLNVITPNAASGFGLPAIGGAAGTFTWTHRFFFNDTNAAPIQANNFVSIHHLMGQTTGNAGVAFGAGVDDRAFGVEMVDAGDANPFSEQSLSQYNERIMTNNSLTCAPVGGGLPWAESCAAAGRFVFSDTRTAPTNSSNTASPLEALAGVASSASNTNAFGSCGFPVPCILGVKGGAFELNNSQNGQGGFWVGVYGGASGGASNTNGSGAAFVSHAPGTRFATTNFGYVAADEGSNVADWNFFSQSNTPATSGRNFFGGPTYLNNILTTLGQINQTGSESVAGGVVTAQLTAAPNVNGNNIFTSGTAGSSTNNYKVFGVDANGNEGGSFTTSIATANANLTSTNSTTIQISSPPANGYSSYNLYRTASASQCNGVACTNGKIVNVAASVINQTGNSTGNIVLTDTGQVGDGNATAGQSNTTGAAIFIGTERDGGTCRILSDVSLTVNTANPFCTFNLPATALGWAFTCDIQWAITAGTGTNTFALGVNASQTPAATTNVDGTVYTTATGTETDASVALSASGALNVLTGATYTPAATVLKARVYGTLSANAAAGTLAITATANGTTATAAVKAGTVCRLQ